MRCFNSLSERHCPFEVDKLLWSSKMDLLALSSSKGDLFLQRLFWKKAWHRSAPDETTKISGLCWSPCGNYIVVAYSNSQILICSVENGKVAHEVSSAGQLHYSEAKVLWFNQKKPVGRSKYRCDHSILPSLHKVRGNSGSKETDRDNFFVKLHPGEKPFETLLVFNHNSVSLFAHGFFLLTKVNLSHLSLSSNEDQKIIDATLSEDLSRLLLCCQSSSRYSYAVIDSSLLETEQEAMVELTVRFNNLLSSCWHLTEAIASVKNSWEDILLDIDVKFAQFAKAKFLTGTGQTVGDDLLEHLAFGIMSAELEQFLLHDLTEKGLKKLGLCVENTYTTVQKLISTDLELISATMVSELAQLIRLCESSRLWWNRTFQKIGLSEELVRKAYSVARAFAFKVTEVQTVISENLRNFKSFFRWLYNCIINSSGENGANVPPEQKKFTQEDIDFVCQFIQDNFFHEWTGENPVMFKLERVGQYLSDKPLLYQFDSRNSAWEILKQCGSDVNEHIGDCRPESSLISLELELKQVIQDVVNNVNLVVSESLKLLSAGLLISVEPIDSVKLKCCYGQPGHFQVFATKRTLTNTGEFHRFVMDPLTGAFIAQSVGKYEKLVHSIADFDIYNTETIALLLSKPTIDHHHRFFVAMHKLSPYEISKKAKQHTVEPLVEDWSDELNDSSCYQEVSDTQAAQLCVSGTRKVGCILFTSRNQLRLVEFEPEEESSSLSAQISGLME